MAASIANSAAVACSDRANTRLHCSRNSLDAVDVPRGPLVPCPFAVGGIKFEGAVAA
jgi:hypothetical protein